jgi:acyl-CoA synthetase (AMP-forming)/AMP-acid ligase II
MPAMIDWFDRGWKINSHGVAYYMDGKEWTFNEIGEFTCRTANALLAAGFKKGTIGAVWSDNHPLSWACTLSLWRAGLAWTPVHPNAPLEETAFLLDSFDVEILFFTKAYSKAVLSLKDKLPKIRLWICIDDEVEGALSLTHFIQNQPVTRPNIQYKPEDVVVVIPTGGTTGMPKGVMQSNRSYSAAFACFEMHCFYPNTVYPVNLAAAPMTHTAGLLTMPCTGRGGKVVVLPRAEPKPMFEAIVKQRVTEFFLPPTVIYRMLDIPGIDKVDFSSVKYLMYGAAPMSVAKLKQALKLFGPILMEAYGQTEAVAPISCLRPEEHFKEGLKELADDSRLASSGRPTWTTRVEIMDDDNNILSAGKTGEICISGDVVMTGYYNNPQKTAETIINGWLHTGDVGHLDEDGYLFITDRKKDMIITGGFNVYPSEVEQVLWGHPSVGECAVIGVPSPDWGEEVKAVVELKPGMKVTAEELIALCKEKLGSISAPKSVDFTDALPRSRNSKVLKKDLREQYWKGHDKKI